MTRRRDVRVRRRINAHRRVLRLLAPMPLTHLGAYFDRESHPMDWARWLATRSLCKRAALVARTDVGKHTVSTIWLGLDHSAGYGARQTFESAIVTAAAGDAPESINVAARYSTIEQARAGHTVLVAHLTGNAPAL